MLTRFALLTALVTASCSAWASDILTSIKPIQMITHELTAEVSEPDVLLSANASPHDYALRPSDVKRIHQASLVIWFGPDLEPFLEKVLSSHPNVLTLSSITDLNLRAYSAEELEHGHDDGHHHHGTHDPHFWLGIEQAKQVAAAIAQRLSETDPEHAKQYASNLERFLQQADETDSAIRAQLADVKSVPYYVFHDAYDYFEQRYGLNNLGHFTVSPDRKPGAKTLIAIRKSLAENQAKCVFSEPQFQPAVIETVVRGSHAHIGVLDPLGTQVPVKAGSYFAFLHQLSDSYAQCLSQ
ncbi:zinc ABC transporter substrate-binding protein ZnuA [Vibrio fluvialis]|uniref:zinc ABC transporter substrate-binding protein ZnuA n=1 Tax=Vibrio fluvialis TaxID=676 RepID=UPI00192BE36D|nr:zinc ABC transporter substrate-binding protein ZnuA [Vibrio fluvialis]MBL4285176.1 zinc ABC transporter substrate-binding protein ZnuA [Vibrio fluvialis]MBL4289733.1 zinc ABC transporter substrate-binding protein ZnuA [Vibrio fluvialis]